MTDIAVIGTGSIGSTTSVGMSQLGHQCTGYDVDSLKILKIKGGELTILEPGLAEGLDKLVGSGTLTFTGILELGCIDVDALIVGTEWEALCHIEPDRHFELLASKNIFDLLSILNKDEWERTGAKFFARGGAL
jgi:UDP-glucose 6-dehydrogenase